MNLNEIKRCAEVLGSWNGKDSGLAEDRANIARDVLEAVRNLEELLSELVNEIPQFAGTRDALDKIKIR